MATPEGPHSLPFHSSGTLHCCSARQGQYHTPSKPFYKIPGRAIAFHNPPLASPLCDSAAPFTCHSAIPPVSFSSSVSALMQLEHPLMPWMLCISPWKALSLSFRQLRLVLCSPLLASAPFCELLTGSDVFFNLLWQHLVTSLLHISL